MGSWAYSPDVLVTGLHSYLSLSLSLGVYLFVLSLDGVQQILDVSLQGGISRQINERCGLLEVDIY